MVRTYTVRKGDTLSGIAARFGLDWRKLWEWNKDIIPNTNLIRPGQVIRLEPPPPPKPTPTPPPPPPKSVSPSPLPVHTTPLPQQILNQLSQNINKQVTNSINTSISTIQYQINQASTEPILSRIWDTLVNIGNWFRDLFLKLGDVIKGVTELVTNLLREEGWLYKIFQKLADFLRYISSGFLEFISDPLGTISSALSTVLQTIGDYFMEFGDLLSDVIKKSYEAIKVNFENIKDFFEETVWRYAEYLWRNTKTAINNVIHEIIDPLGDTARWITDRVKEVIVWLGEKIESIFLFIFKEGWVVIKTGLDKIYNFLNRLLKPSLDTAIEFIHFAWELLVKAINSLINYATHVVSTLVLPIAFQFINELRNILVWRGTAEIDIHQNVSKLEYELWDTAVKGLDFSMRAGTAASFWATFSIPQINLHLPYIGGILADLGSWKWVMDAVINTFVENVYKIHAKWIYRAKYRPELPPWYDVQEMYRRYYIDDDTFYKRFTFEGIPDSWFEYYKLISRRPIDPFTFSFLAQTGAFDEETADKLVKEMGYLEHVRDYIKKGGLMWATSPYKTSIRHLLVNLYSLGALHLDEVVKTQIEYMPVLEYKPLIEKEAELEDKLTTIKEKIDILEDKFEKEEITEDVLREELSKIIVDPEKVERRIEKLKLKKLKKPEPEKGKEIRSEIKTILIRCYKDGFIDQNKLRSTIEASNTIADEQVLMNIRAEWEMFYDDKKEELESLKSDVLLGEISFDEFIKKLSEIVPREAKRNIIIKNIKSRLKSKYTKERNKIEATLDRLEIRRREISYSLKDIEKSLESETDTKKIANLQKKYEILYNKLITIEEEIEENKSKLNQIPVIT